MSVLKENPWQLRQFDYNICYLIDSFKVNESMSNISFFLSPDTVISDLNNSSIQNLIASSRGTLVKSESTSYDAIKQFESSLNISLAN